LENIEVVEALLEGVFIDTAHATSNGSHMLKADRWLLKAIFKRKGDQP
jgi:hypothetical protein